MQFSPLDYFGCVFIVLANVCWFGRKYIIVKNGGIFDFFDSNLKDRGRLNKIIEALPKSKTRMRYTLLNYLFPAFFIAAGLFFALGRLK